MGSIYKITNTVNGKCYIGQTVRDAISSRISRHLNGQGSKLIASAVKKYGVDAFTFEILHDGVFGFMLDNLEKEAIQKYNSISPHGYNLTLGGEGGIPSEETRKKMSQSRKGRPSPNLGKTFSIEHRRKLSESHKGKKLPPRSKEHRRKLSEINKRKTISEQQKIKISNTLKEQYKSNPEFRRRLSEAAKGRKHTEETKQKIGEVHKGNKYNLGKRYSPEHRQKISNSMLGNKHRLGDYSIDYYPAREFYFSLPSDMSIRNKRKLLYDKFPNRGQRTIRSWTLKWSKEC